MSLNVPGLIVMAVFYLLILGTGIWASMRSRKEEKKCTGDGMEITLLAGRKINLLVGIFTLTGTHPGPPLPAPRHALSEPVCLHSDLGGRRLHPGHCGGNV